jgi:hypothetical protein
MINESEKINYTQEQLEQAFRKVQNSIYWKNPIDSFCFVNEMDVTREAIIHFTATVPNFRPMGNNLMRVSAKGYHLGPAGDK